jgi:hypothetical protein
VSTQEWDARIEHADADRLRAENERLIRRCAYLETCIQVANGSLIVAVRKIDELEQQVSALAGDLLLDRAFDGPGAP